jgi:hypothetical protein
MKKLARLATELHMHMAMENSPAAHVAAMKMNLIQKGSHKKAINAINRGLPANFPFINRGKKGDRT